MLDEDTARACADALSSAIAALAEDAVELGAEAGAQINDYAQRAAALKALADDMRILADALAVIARHAQQSPPPAEQQLD